MQMNYTDVDDKVCRVQSQDPPQPSDADVFLRSLSRPGESTSSTLKRPSPTALSKFGIS